MKRWQLFPLLLTIAVICLPELAVSQPDIEIAPRDFEFDNPWQIEQRQFTISNNGNSNLEWLGTIEILQEPRRLPPLRDDPGDLLAQFRGINADGEQCSPCAWDRDNEIMWITNPDRRLIVGYRHDDQYENFEEVMRIDAGAYFDGAWANGLLYLPALFQNRLDRFNAEGQNIGAIQMPFRVVGIAADVEDGWLFLMDAAEQAIHVFPLEMNGGIGDEIGVIENHLQYHNNSETFGFEWVSKHPDGQLWMVSPDNGQVHQIAVDTEIWQCTGEVQEPFTVFPGDEEPRETTIGHDGHYLWVGGFSEDHIRIYDDGVMERFWLSFEPIEGEIEPNGESVVTLFFDPTGLIGGIYQADINILSNDPADPSLAVHVFAEIIVEGGIRIEWPEQAGFPDMIDFNQAFDNDVFVGFEREIEVMITNEGIDDLEIMEVFTDNEYFFFEPNGGMIIVPGRAFQCQLTFLTDEAGLYEGTLTFVTNDPDEEVIEISIRAQAILPPIIVVDSDEIECELAWREALVLVVYVSNDGESDLRWYSELAGAQDNVRLNIEPFRHGVIAAGMGAEVILIARFIETDSLPSEFDLTFFSNDPETPEKVVHIVIQTLDVVDAQATLPTTTRLVSLYPNPFNSTISIQFGLDKSAPTRLAVYGVDGRLVKDLIDGLGTPSYAPGYHNLVWNAGGIPAGSYLVRLEAGEGVVQEQWVRLVK